MGNQDRRHAKVLPTPTPTSIAPPTDKNRARSEFLLDLGDPADHDRCYVMLSAWREIIDKLYDTFPDDQPKMAAIQTWMNREDFDQVRVYNRIRECRDLVALETDPKNAFFRALAKGRRSIEEQHKWAIDKRRLPPRLHPDYDRFVTQTKFVRR